MQHGSPAPSAQRIEEERSYPYEGNAWDSLDHKLYIRDARLWIRSLANDYHDPICFEMINFRLLLESALRLARSSLLICYSLKVTFPYVFRNGEKR
jgi:hypothetical protein